MLPCTDIGVIGYCNERMLVKHTRDIFVVRPHWVTADRVQFDTVILTVQCVPPATLAFA